MIIRGSHPATTTLVMLALATASASTACGGDDAEDTEPLLESPTTEVGSTAETHPVPRGGDADDPAIWVHPDDRANSTIIGTDKLGGLAFTTSRETRSSTSQTAISTTSTSATASHSAASR